MSVATDIASVTIISRDSVASDIWSTAGFLPSVSDAVACLNQQTGIEAVVISKQGETHVTQGLVDDGHCILPCPV